MMVPRTWRQLDGEKSEDVVQEWLFLKTGALVADWKLLHVLDGHHPSRCPGIQGAVAQSGAQLSITLNQYFPPDTQPFCYGNKMVKGCGVVLGYSYSYLLGSSWRQGAVQMQAH